MCQGKRVASLVATILGFIVHMVLSPLLEDTSSMGTGIRIILAGSVSMLASVGFYIFHSAGQDIFNKKEDVQAERPLSAKTYITAFRASVYLP